jgi:hypothetical protein
MFSSVFKPYQRKHPDIGRMPPSSPIQTLLSAFESHEISKQRLARSRAEKIMSSIPPVGNFTLPRRWNDLIFFVTV